MTHLAVQNTKAGIWLMIATTLVFAAQDGISRHLGSNYPVTMVVMIRFWFFALFVLVLAARSEGGLRAAARSHFPWVQLARGVILVAEIAVMVIGFVKLGLINAHAVFACYPLLIAALSGPILGEKVGWRRWLAILAGAVGILIILQPGFGVFSPWALVALLAATMFAVYGLLTRYVARKDSASVSFFWTGVVAAVAVTPFGLMHWTWMTPRRLGVDGGPVLHGRAGPLALDQGLCRGRGLGDPAVCLPATRLGLRHRHDPVWRDPADQRRHRRGDRGGGRRLHALAPARA
jgi:drug/metabolite transporter (DMT)-like permease